MKQTIFKAKDSEFLKNLNPEFWKNYNENKEN